MATTQEALRLIADWLDTHDLEGARVMHAGILYGRPSIVLHGFDPLRKAYPDAEVVVSHHETCDCHEFNADGIHFQGWVTRKDNI